MRFRSHKLWLLILLYAVLYAVLSSLRFATFHAQIDLSYYIRLIWGMGAGHYDLPLVRAQNILGLHAEPILLPFALLSALHVPLAWLLLWVQAGSVALLAWPASRMSARRLAPLFLSPTCDPIQAAQRAGFLGALLALLFPTVTVATLHDFHPVTLALAPLMAVLDALDDATMHPQPQRALQRAAWFALLALACREDIALQLAFLLIGYLLPGPGQLRALLHAPRAKWLSLAILIGLFLYCFGYLLWLQPRFVPKIGSYGLHFGWLRFPDGAAVHSARDLLRFMTHHPVQFLTALASLERLTYLGLLLWPVAALPLFAPRPLCGLLPILGINLLSGFPRVLRLESHYTTAMVPFLLAAALLGTQRLHAWLTRRAPSAAGIPLIALLLLATATAHLFHGASPLSFLADRARFSPALFRPGPHHPTTVAWLATLPPTTSVAAPPGILAHVADRPRALCPPDYLDDNPAPIDRTFAEPLPPATGHFSTGM